MMRALAGELLLAAWERGAPEHTLRRPLALLAAARPDMDPGQLGALPLAERNLLLVRLHELSFGPMLAVFGLCPACGAQLEFAVQAAGLATQLADQAPASPVMTWHEDGQRYRLRAVTTDDLLATLAAPQAAAAQEALLGRCLEVSPAPGEGTPLTSQGVLRRFGELNAAAELSCAVDCPECSGRDLLDLDLARFVWAEVKRAAQRLLGEVHVLASAYGWSERAITRMSAGRRTAYLEMLSL